MNEVGFIVDGFMEKRIVEHICPRAPVNRLDLNGKSVSIEAIARKAATYARILRRRCLRVIIVVDREARKESSQSIARELSERIAAEGVDDFVIAVSDRMSENWMLADLRGVERYLSLPSGTLGGTYEGSNGKATLKSLFRAQSRSYQETLDGADLFCSCDPKTIASTSESFRALLEACEDIPCHFLAGRLDSPASSVQT